ncbi:tape measure protein, partial [Weissella thailandensis]
MADGKINIDLILDDQTDKTWTDFKSKAEQQGKEGYETFKKSFGNEPLIAKLEAKAETEGVDNFQELLAEIPEEEQTELLAKAEKGEIKTFDDLLNALPEETRTELQAKAHTADIRTFDDLLNEVPEDVRTELKAKAEKGEIISFDDLLAELPEETRTELKAKAERGEVASFNQILKTVPMSTKTKLQVDAQRHGIDNFDKLLKKLPKKTRTELLAKAEKGEVIDYERLLNEVPKKYVTNLQLNDNASSGLQNIQHEAQETKSKFSGLKDIISGSFVGNVAAQGIGKVTGYLTGLVSEAGKASDAMQGFDATMQLAGFGKDKIKSVGKDVKKYADDTVYDLEDVSNTTAQLAANGVDNFEKLTESAGNLTAVAGGTKDDFKSVAMVMTQTASAGKLTTENWNQLTDAIPGASGKLQEAMKKNGAFTGDFREAMEKGQISADEFNKAIDKLGSTDKAKKFAKGTAEFQGAFGNLEAEVVNGWQKIIDAVGKKNLTDIINNLADVATKAFSGIAKGVKVMSDQLGKLKKHPAILAALTTAFKALGAAIAIFAGAKGAIMAVTAITKIGTAFSKLSALLAANPFLAIVAAIGGVVIALVSLYKHNKKFRNFVNGIVDAVVEFAKGVGKWFGNAFDTIGDFFKGIGKSFSNGGKTIQKFTKSISKWFKGIGKSIGNGASAIGGWFSGLIKGFRKGWNKFIKGVKKLAKGFGKTMLYALSLPVGIAMTITKPLVGGLKKIINSLIKWIKKAWNGTVGFLNKIWAPVQKTWTKVWNAIADFFNNIWNGKHGIKRLFTNAINSISSFLSKMMNHISKTWNKTWNAVANFFNNIWNGKHGIKRLFANAINAVSSYLSKMMAHISRVWRKSWHAISNFFEGIWNGIKKFFGKIYDWFTSRVSSLLKSIQNTWNKVWSSISSFFTDIWNGIIKTASDVWNWMSDKLVGFGTNVSNTWTNMWTGIKDFFSDIWDDIKGLAKDGMNGIIGFINTGVSGINGVIHNFGGKKQTIKPLKKLATGTAGAPSGLAMVNDGFDSPTGQELIIDNKGQGTILPGRNRLVNFEGGETVVPASVTEAMLGGHKFANGTGGWFGGVKSFFGDVADDISDAISSATGKAKDFLNIAMHPVKYIEDKVFNPMTKGFGGLSGKAFSSLGSAVGGSKGVKGQQSNWWHELWKMLKDTMSGAGGGGGLGDDYRFKNKSKDEGMPSGDPWGYFFRECVSFVASRLANVGVKPSLFTGLGNGSNWTSARAKHKSTPSVGDVAVYSKGSKYGNHVSVVTGVNNGRYSEEGYNYGGNGKYYKSSGLKFGDATTFLDFGKSAAKGKKSANKSDSPLQKLIRSQVSGIFDWVSDMMSGLLGSFNGGGEQASGPGAKPSGSYKNWLKQAGVKSNFDKWNYIINHESGWNPKAQNPSSSAYGIGQALPPSKMASFGSDYMTNPITQLKWMKSYVNGRYGGIKNAYAF